MIVEIVEKQKMIVVVETPEEAVEALDCFTSLKPSNTEYIDYVTGKKNEFMVTGNRTMREQNSGFVRTTVETDFLDPYLDELKKCTGFDARVENFQCDMTEAVGGIYHTHICESFVYKDHKALFTWVGQVYTWQGYVLRDDVYNLGNDSFRDGQQVDRLTLSQKANEIALRHVADKLGKSVVESEYVEVGNGLYRRNPKYGTYNPQYDHVAQNDKVWKQVWMEWYNKFASNEQKAALDRMSDTSNRKLKVPMPLLCHLYGGLHLDNYKVTMSWDEFSALGRKAAV